MSMSPWTSLPLDVFKLIINRLLLLEFLAFRSVCRIWRQAASTCNPTTAQSMENMPWMLLYRDDIGDTSPECSLYNASSKKTYTIRIPELSGTSCIASKEGWLLLHRCGHIFFLNPFSGAIIDLPEFPYTVLDDHVATFSSLPTKEDYTVFVINRCNDTKLEVCTCHRGDGSWTRDYLDADISIISTITYATFNEEEGLFYFLDSGVGLGTYDAKLKNFKAFIIVSSSSSKTDKILPLDRKVTPFSELIESEPDLRNWLSKSNEKSLSVHFTTCGTSMKGSDFFTIIPSEHKDLELKKEDAEVEQIRVRLVWVKPCFAELPSGADY